MSPAPETRLGSAVAAFAAWQAHGTAPRDAVAAAVDRTAPAEVHAEVAAVVYGAIRDLRRLEWALGDALEPLDGTARSQAIVLAHLVEVGLLEPPVAAQRAHAAGLPTLDFAAVTSAVARALELPPGVPRLGLRYSVPDWLVERLLAEFGPATEGVLAGLAAAAPRTIRANRLRVSDRQQLARELAEHGVSTAPTAFAPDGLTVAGEASLFALPPWRSGSFEQQDEGSQLVAAVVAPPPRGRVLDACAGAGGKTLALAAALGNAGAILAVDVHERRLAALRERARRAGAHNVQARVVAADAWPAEVRAFAARADRILLDVPCSGTGSWRRRPEARWSLQPTDVDGLLALQRELIDRAAAALAPGARLVYATCSLLRAENEDQVTAALQRQPALELVPLKEVLGAVTALPIADSAGRWLTLRPDRHGTDGFFAAILRRRR